MAVQLDDDDDMKFSAGASSYKENEGEGSSLLPARELEFREYLCDSKAVDEVVRLLVGLAETPGGLPENPVANWRAMYDAELEAFKGKDHLLGGLQGPTLTSGRAAEDIPALLDENDQLRARDAELSAKLHEVVSVIEAKDAEAAAVVIDALVAGGVFASAEAEDCLDVGKLCTRSSRASSFATSAVGQPTFHRACVTLSLTVPCDPSLAPSQTRPCPLASPRRPRKPRRRRCGLPRARRCPRV